MRSVTGVLTPCVCPAGPAQEGATGQSLNDDGERDHGKRHDDDRVAPRVALRNVEYERKRECAAQATPDQGVLLHGVDAIGPRENRAPTG